MDCERIDNVGLHGQEDEQEADANKTGADNRHDPVSPLLGRPTVPEQPDGHEWAPNNHQR